MKSVFPPSLLIHPWVADWKVGTWKSRLSKYAFPIGAALSLRIGLSAWLAMVWLVVDSRFQFTGRVRQEIYGGLTPAATPLGRALIDVWLRWDASHYMNIARQGYSGAPLGDLNFPPLYPTLVLWLKPLFFHREILTGLIVATLASLVAFILLYKLVEESFADRALARQTILVLSIYPTSFFLFAPYTDSLFLALSIGFFLLLRRQQWIPAGTLIALATLTRLQGIVLVIPFLFEAWRTKSYILKRANWKPFFGLGLASLGYFLYEIHRSLYGMPGIFTTYVTISKNIFVDPVTGIWLAFKQALVTREILVISELLSVVLFLALLIWMLFQKKYQRQLPMLLYGIALILLFTTKHNLVASALQSSNRYVIGAFPAFIGMADIVNRLSSRKRFLYHLASLTLLLVASAAYALFIFVG